jgi:hypothetical protein
VSGHAFTRSIEAPRSRSCCLYAGRRLGSKRVPPRLIPGHLHGPGFDVVFGVSTRQRQRACAHRSSSRPIPDAIEPRLFPRRSAQRSSANAPVGGLKPPPRRAAPEGQTTSITSTAPQSAGPPSNTSSCLLRSCSQCKHAPFRDFVFLSTVELRQEAHPKARSRRGSPRRGVFSEDRLRSLGAIHPSGLPLARGRADGTGRRLGFPRASHPADQEPDNARRGGDRPASTGLELHAQHHIR